MISESRIAEAFWEHGRCDDCPVIDMHGHMGAIAGMYLPRADTEAMVRTMDHSGVRMLVFCHHAALFSPDIGNAVNIEAVRKFPDRLRSYVGINPHYPEAVAKDLAEFDKNRDVFVGLKLLADYHRVPWDAPAYEPAWRFANDRGLPLLGHTWGGSAFNGSAQVRKAAQKYPNVRLIAAHSISGEWDAAIDIAKSFPNVYLDLDPAVVRTSGPIENFIAAGLSEKLLFGTDLPWFDPRHDIGCVLSADISDEDRRNIFHRNAQRLLAQTGTKLPASLRHA